MPDVRIPLGAAGHRAGAMLHLGSGKPTVLPGPEFEENVATFTMSDYVILDGRPVADADGAKINTTAGADAATALAINTDPATLFPEAFAHWTPGLAHMSMDGTLYRWWPIGSPRTSEDARMSLFKQNRDPNSSGAMEYGDGVGAPQIDESYTYQAFGRQLTKKAVTMDSRGYMKIDPEASFTSATFIVTAVMHPSDLPYYGIFEAAQELDTTSNTLIGDPLVLRWHHGQFRLYHSEDMVLAHEAHRASAAPIIMAISMDSVSDVGRFYALDNNRTTRTFNTEGMDYVSLLGIFGGLGQGVIGNPYRMTADMDVLDVCLWDTAMDWPELEAKVNRLALAFGMTA